MRTNSTVPTTYMALSRTKKNVLNCFLFKTVGIYCSGTISITFLEGWGSREINVVLNTHTYNSLSTIPNMYIIYRHRRDDRPLELWGISQTLTYDDWHWALQHVKKIYTMANLGNVFLSFFFFKDNWPRCLPEWNCTKYGLHIGLLRTQDTLSQRKLIDGIQNIEEL